MPYSTLNLIFDYRGHKYDYILEKSGSSFVNSLVVLLPGLGDDCHVHAELLKKYLKDENFDFFRLAYQEPLTSESIGNIVESVFDNHDYERLYFCSYSIGGLLVNEILNYQRFSYVNKVRHSFYIAPVFSKNLVKHNVRFIVEHDTFFNIMSFCTNSQFRKSRTSGWRNVNKAILREVREGKFLNKIDVPSTYIVFEKDRVCMPLALRSTLSANNVKQANIYELKSTKKAGKLGHAPCSWNEVFSLIASDVLKSSKS